MSADAACQLVCCETKFKFEHLNPRNSVREYFTTYRMKRMEDELGWFPIKRGTISCCQT